MIWVSLSALRFFLAFIVFICHFFTFFYQIPDSIHLKFLAYFLRLLGLPAVIGFLLISGYSIAHSVHNKVKGFYKRRILRLYPLYFISILYSFVPFLIKGQNLIVLTGVSSEGNFRLPSFENTILNMSFLQFITGDQLSSNRVVWSLALEVSLYLLAPFLIRINSVTLLVLSIVSSCIYVIYPLTNLPYFSGIPLGLNIIFLGWPWLLGFYYYSYKDILKSSNILYVSGCLTLILNLMFSLRTHSLIVIAASAVTQLSIYTISCFILINSNTFIINPVIINVFNILGKLSYPLYLFHIPTSIICYSVLGFRNFWAHTYFVILISYLMLILFDNNSKLQKTKLEK
ncbi:MAG: acyltransferase family protein [Dolichospermum sp.]